MARKKTTRKPTTRRKASGTRRKSVRKSARPRSAAAPSTDEDIVYSDLRRQSVAWSLSRL